MERFILERFRVPGFPFKTFLFILLVFFIGCNEKKEKHEVTPPVFKSSVSDNFLDKSDKTKSDKTDNIESVLADTSTKTHISYLMDFLIKHPDIDARMKRLVKDIEQDFIRDMDVQDPIMYFQGFMIFEGHRLHFAPQYRSILLLDVYNNELIAAHFDVNKPKSDIFYEKGKRDLPWLLINWEEENKEQRETEKWLKANGF